jgi:hypothetical protein
MIFSVFRSSQTSFFSSFEIQFAAVLSQHTPYSVNVMWYPVVVVVVVACVSLCVCVCVCACVYVWMCVCVVRACVCVCWCVSMYSSQQVCVWCWYVCRSLYSSQVSCFFLAHHVHGGVGGGMVGDERTLFLRCLEVGGGAGANYARAVVADSRLLQKMMRMTAADIEEWKNERRRNWPTEANMKR